MGCMRSIHIGNDNLLYSVFLCHLILGTCACWKREGSITRVGTMDIWNISCNLLVPQGLLLLDFIHTHTHRVKQTNKKYIASKIQRSPSRHCVSIWAVWGARCNNLSFTLRGISQHAPYGSNGWICIVDDYLSLSSPFEPLSIIHTMIYMRFQPAMGHFYLSDT